MNKAQNAKPIYDLEERTRRFSSNIMVFCKTLPFSIENNEVRKQLIRSACSVGANYIEANESLSKKDFIMRIKICRKEAKETQYWLYLLHNSINIEEKVTTLLQEARELTKIFGSILTKSS